MATKHSTKSPRPTTTAHPEQSPVLDPIEQAISRAANKAIELHATLVDRIEPEDRLPVLEKAWESAMDLAADLAKLLDRARPMAPAAQQPALFAPYIEKPADAIGKKSAQLYSMLTCIYGEGFETFDTYNDTIKDNYLWACADMAREIHELSSRVTSVKARGEVAP